MSIELEITRTFNASQEKVFQAFTDPAILKQWFAPGPMNVPRAEMDTKVGGAYLIEMKDPAGESHTVSGTIKEFQPHEKLSYTWKWASPDSVETLVTILFRSKGQNTEVCLKHVHFKTEEAKELHNQGWEGCLAKLEKFYQ